MGKRHLNHEGTRRRQHIWRRLFNSWIKTLYLLANHHTVHSFGKLLVWWSMRNIYSSILLFFSFFSSYTSYENKSRKPPVKGARADLDSFWPVGYWAAVRATHPKMNAIHLFARRGCCQSYFVIPCKQGVFFQEYSFIRDEWLGYSAIV